MPLLSCPKEENLLQYLSIPHDMGWIEKYKMRAHLRSCHKCATKSSVIQEKLDSYFSPETDITSSLLKVYSKLQNDETLILKGWKLNEISGSKHARTNATLKNWLFRGGVAVSLGCLMVLFLLADQDKASEATVASNQSNEKVPFAQVRFQNKNRIQVQYLKPELVQSVEFETTGRR